MKRIRCWSKSNSTNRTFELLKRLNDSDNATDISTNQNMPVLTTLEKNQRHETKIFLRKCNSFIKDGELWRRKC